MEFKTPPRAVAFILLAASLLMLSGCLGSPGLGACASFVKPADQDSCVYYNAVIDQIPARCYGVSNMSLRETCLIDSNDPIAQRNLQDMQAQLAGESDVTVSQNAQQAPPSPSAPADPVSMCMEEQKVSREACMRAVAIEKGDLSLCNKIQDGEYRQNCVSNIAVTAGHLADCGILERQSDKDICIKYSRIG